MTTITTTIISSVLLVLLSILKGAIGQCLTGTSSCIWTNENPSQPQWLYKSTAGEQFVELTKCRSPSCGTATLLGPLLPGTGSPWSFTLEYKIYGTTSVFLKVYVKGQDQAQPVTLVEKYGNYGEEFPTGWRNEKVNVPASSTPYRLMIKGNTPYGDAYIAVMGVRLGATPSIITAAPQTGNELENEISTNGKEGENEVGNENNNIVSNKPDLNSNSDYNDLGNSNADPNIAMRPLCAKRPIITFGIFFVLRISAY